MKYLKKFNAISEYDTFKNSYDYILPNVSYIVEENSVHFENETKKEQNFPNNTIIYTGKGWLTETADVSDSKNGKSGLYIYGFSGKNGDLLEIVNHTFNKNDNDDYGVGTIEFNDDITRMGNRAFNQTSCATLELPSTVEQLNKEAIYKCTGLTSITCYAETAPYINSDTFFGSNAITQLYYPKGSDYSEWLSVLGDNCEGIEI